jgi:hypothetical protein
MLLANLPNCTLHSYFPRLRLTWIKITLGQRDPLGRVFDIQEL